VTFSAVLSQAEPLVLPLDLGVQQVAPYLADLAASLAAAAVVEMTEEVEVNLETLTLTLQLRWLRRITL
jgi:hypothetical protein